MTQYAVAWCDQTGGFQAGRLDLERSGLRLEGGRHRGGRLSIRRLLYRDVLEAKMAPSEMRVAHRPTILVCGVNDSIAIAAIGPGLTRELLRLVQMSVESELA